MRRQARVRGQSKPRRALSKATPTNSSRSRRFVGTRKSASHGAGGATSRPDLHKPAATSQDMADEARSRTRDQQLSDHQRLTRQQLDAA
jgi:hypothetical protein